MLARSPVITLWVILALALGIGANVAIFSIVDATLLHPVSYQNPQSLVMLWDRDAQGVNRRASAGNFADWRKKTRSFRSIAGWAPVSFVTTRAGHAEPVTGATVTANFFPTLQVRPALGRFFSEGEDSFGKAGSTHIAVLSYRFWQDAFGGSPGVLGQTVDLNGTAYTIVGVAPVDFQFFVRRQVYVPIEMDPSARDYHYILTVARLAESRSRAQLELKALAVQSTLAFPDSNRGWTFQVQDLLDWVVDPGFRTRLLFLLAAVGMVLLVTCSNVAGLLLTRVLSRQREMAVRTALGAGRLRLIRQLLAESALLAMVGALAGLGVALLLIRSAPSLVPPDLVPNAVPIRLAARELWFTLGVTIAVGMIFGMAPAVSGSRMSPAEALKEGAGRGFSMGRGHQRLRQVMVTLQVAVALVLLVSAALMSQSLSNLANANPGFAFDDVLTSRIYLPASEFSRERTRNFLQAALASVRAMPEAEDVAVASNLPLYGITMEVPFQLEDQPPLPENLRAGVGYVTVSPDYFRTLHIPVGAGRAFGEADGPSSVPVVLVNQAFVDRYCASGNPLAMRVILSRPMAGKVGFEQEIHAQIVGVVGNVRLGREAPDPRPVIYAPEEQNLWSEYYFMAVKTRGAPARLAPTLRSTLTKLDPSNPMIVTSTLETTFAAQFSEPQFQTRLMSAFSALALLLAVIGIYGVNSYAVAQRRGEIAVRMALGATPGAVLWEVIASGMQLAAVGIAAGVGGALAISKVMRGFLIGVNPDDPFTIASVALALAMVALIACYLPARRAALTAPAIALRGD